MSPRVSGASLALIAAVLLALSGATSAWWRGAATVGGHTREAQTFYIGLHGAERCNTGGDGECHDVSPKAAFTGVGYAELGLLGVAALVAAGLAFATWRASESRLGAAKVLRGAVGVAAVGAIVLSIIGPTDQGSIPVGFGTIMFWLGAVASVVASFVAVKPPPPIRLVTPHGNSAFPTLPLDAIAGLPSAHQADAASLLYEAPPAPAPMYSPAALGSRRPPPVPVPMPLRAAAAELAADAAPTHGFEPPSTPFAAPPGHAFEAPSFAAPPTPAPFAPPPSPFAARPPTNPPPFAAPPTPAPFAPPPSMFGAPAPTNPPPFAAPPTPAPFAPPPSMFGAPAPTSPPPFAAPPTPAQFAPSMFGAPAPANPPPGARAPTNPPPNAAAGRIPPTPMPRPPIPRTLPPPIGAKQTGPLAPIATAPAAPPIAANPMPRPSPITRPPPLAMPSVPARGPKPMTLPPLPKPAAAVASPEPIAAPSGQPTGSMPIVGDSTSPNVVPFASRDEMDMAADEMLASRDELGDVAGGNIADAIARDADADRIGASTDISPRAPENPDVRVSASLPIAPPPPAEIAAPLEPVAAAPSVPLSTAPDSLPPPKEATSSGPSPACPQCEAPMAWVEEHLRFYCKSCRMYF